MNPTTFSELLLAWFDQHGRKNLPWQQAINSYRVWVSEIMLQQTQVTTVIPYFERFMSHFPDVMTLAAASLDEVMHLWTGLGYYARARNLHRAAQVVCEQYGGSFPQELGVLAALPGIGRSTAGAILSIAGDQPVPILDGNVKRVLTRFHAIAGWPGEAHVTKQLWELAARYTPSQRCAAYTQAMMDLGATVCTRTKPRCHHCPLQRHCVAHAMQSETHYPVKKQGKRLPIRSVRFLMLFNQRNEIFLEKRPPTGIWGGLWSFPECPTDVDIHAWCERYYASQVAVMSQSDSFRHTFSHFHLDITPLQLRVVAQKPLIKDDADNTWYNPKKPILYGFPAPVRRLLESL